MAICNMPLCGHARARCNTCSCHCAYVRVSAQGPNRTNTPQQIQASDACTCNALNRAKYRANVHKYCPEDEGRGDALARLEVGRSGASRWHPSI
eukprot:3639674-Alexandrium_andersonii.AAC.1